jgi:hypothetical protein
MSEVPFLHRGITRNRKGERLLPVGLLLFSFAFCTLVIVAGFREAAASVVALMACPDAH